MHSGAFNKQIFDALGSCRDVMLILPPNALDRCVNESDWVRIELSYALRNQKNIIPVIMKDFEFPESLPYEIDRIRYIEGVKASNEYFDAVVQRIESMMRCKKKH